MSLLPPGWSYDEMLEAVREMERLMPIVHSATTSRKVFFDISSIRSPDPAIPGAPSAARVNGIPLVVDPDLTEDVIRLHDINLKVVYTWRPIK